MMADEKMPGLVGELKSAADLSPASALIGARFIAWDEAAQTASFAFAAPASFANARGGVQGGLIAAFLDEVMGAALFCQSGGKALPTTLDLTMSLIRPVPIAALSAKGRVIKLGRRVAYLEAELFDAEGALLARATCTAIPTSIAGTD